MTTSLPTTATPVTTEATAPRPRRVRQIAATLLAIGLASSVAVIGSQASWTAQTENAGNTATAGTLDLTNDKSGKSIFAATNIKPGDTGSGTVKLRNAGTVPLAVKLTQDNVVNGFAATSLKLSVHDDARNWCVYPANAAGTCATTGAWDGTSSLTALALPAIDGAAKWAAGEEHTYTVSWALDLSSPNADQGKVGSFRLVWDGVQ
ncbi:MAG: TasA family protein [Gaiellales bacterium]